ncbi:MAG: hypothetical protein MJ130_09030 [Lachnospiraceae bacterium]|nr:hypothetical protein [Lachnospiraceae bacterium]
MGINSINDYSGIFNNYRVPTIPVVSIDEVAKQDRQRLEAEKQIPVSTSSLEDISLPKARQNNAALEDISLTFNKGDDFGYIGKDSDIFSLDVENAISDMQKDDVLKQYQYFVGNIGGGNNALVDNADGIVIPKY